MIHLLLVPRTVRAAQTTRILRAVLRRPTVGSIAAASRRCRPLCARIGAPAFQQRAQLRQSVPPGSCRTTGMCFAVQRRAPLRHLRRVQGHGLDAGTPARSTAGSIAACSRRPRSAGTSEVLRPSNGGLHCGFSQCRFVASWNRLFPPIKGGLYCGRKPCGSPTPVPVGAPAVPRRAPLRPVRRDDQARSDLKRSRR